MVSRDCETLEHVFKQCPRAHQGWFDLYSKESELGHVASSFMDWIRLGSFITSFIFSYSRCPYQFVFISALWHILILKWRNCELFQPQNAVPMTLLSWLMAARSTKQYMKARLV